MKKGINMWSFPPQFSISESMALAKQAGYDGIELVVGEDGELKFGSSEADVRLIREEAVQHGIEIAGLASGLGWQYGLTSESGEVRQKAMDAISFTDYNAIETPNWTGFQNYVELAHDTIYIKSLTNTLFFVLIGVPCNLIFQLIVASVLNFEVKGIGIFRTLYYLPNLVPMIATVLIFRLVQHGFRNRQPGVGRHRHR